MTWIKKAAQVKEGERRKVERRRGEEMDGEREVKGNGQGNKIK